MVGGWHYRARSGRVAPGQAPDAEMAIGNFARDRKPAPMEVSRVPVYPVSDNKWF